MRPVLPSSSPREPFEPFLPAILQPAPRRRPPITPILPTAAPVSQTLAEACKRRTAADMQPPHARTAARRLGLVHGSLEPRPTSLSPPCLIRPLYGEREGQMRLKKSGRAPGRRKTRYRLGKA